MGWLLSVLLLVILGLIVFSQRYAWWRGAVDSRYPRILMYHMVSPHRPNAKFNKLRVTPDNFANQIAWMVKDGYQFFTMSELVTRWQAGNLLPKSVAITFDDGYQDNLTNALPVLQRYQIPATIYVVVNRHDNDWSTHKKAHHNSGELMQEPKLSDEELQRLVNSGLIEIGGHTMTHANLNAIDEAKRQWEMAESRHILQQQTGQAVNSFAYPFGIYGDNDVAMAKRLGYQHAVTTIEGIDGDKPDFMQLKRIKISGKDNLFTVKLRLKTGKRGK